MARALTLLALCVLGLSGCLRFGYAELRLPAADGGNTGQRDAGAKPDGSVDHDAAASMPDAATSIGTCPADCVTSTTQMAP